MNLQEFAKLKEGDKFKVPSAGNSEGEVVEISPSGVHVVWGENKPGAMRFFYSVNSTAWFNWVKNEESAPGVDSGN